MFKNFTFLNSNYSLRTQIYSSLIQKDTV